MDGERKYFGMTMMQVGIIGGMVVVLLVLVCVGGYMVLRNRGQSASTQPMFTIAPTVTSVVVVQPTMTTTPLPTSLPYEQLVPAGWNQYKTPLVEIWLPNNFKLADKKTQNTSAGFSTPELLITEIPSKSSAYNMLVGVSWEVMTGDSLDTFIQDQFPALPYQAHVSDYRTVYVNSVEARRIVLELRVNNTDINDMVYVFQDGNTVWYVEYIAQIAEFFDNLPVFEQSIKTFRPVKY